MGQTYKEMLQSPLWQKKRLEVFNQKGFRCEECGDEESQLAVHHKYYKKDFKPWEYEDDVYMVLCTPCHDKVHKAKKIVLTVQEAEMIMIIREKLDKDELNGLYNALYMYAENGLNSFFYLLPYLSQEPSLLQTVREFVLHKDENYVFWKKIRKLEDELSKYK